MKKKAVSRKRANRHCHIIAIDSPTLKPLIKRSADKAGLTMSAWIRGVLAKKLGVVETHLREYR